MCKSWHKLGDGTMKRRTLIPLIILVCFGTAWAATNAFSTRVKLRCDSIVDLAQELSNNTHAPVYDPAEAERILAELKESITQYERDMLFMESSYPGEILLGTTPGGDSTWLQTLCDTRYNGLFKEIRIRRTGNRARYLRINDIEITYATPQGLAKRIFNQGARRKLYTGSAFSLSLPKPMRPRKIRININHKSTGLEIYGVPFENPPIRRRVPKPGPPHHKEVLLGTTSGGHSGWLETLVSSPYHRPIKEIRLKRTGRQANYLRINDIEITHVTPRGHRTVVMNTGARTKLYYDDVFKLSLPRPMNIIKIRVKVDHKSTGLNVYAIY